MKDANNTPEQNRSFRGDKSDASYLLKPSGVAKNRSPIAIIEVEPHGSARVSLGTFTQQQPPKGFIVELNPDPEPPDSLVSKVVSLLKGKSNQYELMLFLENFGLKTTTVEIWEVK